jgi:tetratricopeptide (TPR) repeat protein
MRQFVVLGLIGLLIVVPGCSRKSESERLVEKVKPFVDEGFKAFGERDYRRAIEAWEQALAINPNLTYLKANLGVCYYAVGERDKALELWMAYKEASPKEAHVYNSIAGYYRDSGDLEKAIEYYQEAAKLNPFYHLPHYNIGLVRYSQHRYAEAINAFREALRITPKDPYVLIALAQAYRATGDNVNSLESLQQARVFAPTDFRPRFELVLEYIRLGKLDQAETELNELLNDFPNMHLTYYAKAAYLLAAKDGPNEEEIQAAIDKGRELSPADAPLYDALAGELLVAKGQVAEGVARIAEVFDKLPPGFDVQKSRYLFWMGRAEMAEAPERAKEHLEASLVTFPATADRPEIEKLLAQLG